MANRTLFGSLARAVPLADTTNEAGGVAYKLAPREALAQYVLTGCFNGTFYVSAEDQLRAILALAGACGSEFVAQLAVYARERGYMKDAPALLCAWLAAQDDGALWLPRVFSRVIDNGKMLSNFVQILRSGVVGRKSLGSMPKRLVRDWFSARNDEQIFRQSIGVASPSLADIIRMVHPKPETDSRRALFGYLSGRNPAGSPVNPSHLPPLVFAFEAFKRDPANVDVPDVSHQALTALPLGPEQWRRVALSMGWTATRMNLNTMKRHGVLDDPANVRAVAAKLRSREEILRARAFPYQLFAAYKHAEDVPREIVDALHDAMEIAIENVPTLEGRTVVCVDVSGSMHSPVTGTREGASSVVQCADVAALIAASILRRNPSAEIIVFSDRIHGLRLEPRDSVLTNAQRMAAEPAGGTNCSLPIATLNQQLKDVDTVIMVSDYESWCDPSGRQIRTGDWRQDPTAMMREWGVLRVRNPRARLVCLDLQPNATTQVQTRTDVLNVGGFSDHVFTILSDFAGGEFDGNRWTRRIEELTL